MQIRVEAFDLLGTSCGPPPVLDRAVECGLLVGRPGLTDQEGNPLCAAVRPALIEWSAAATS